MTNSHPFARGLQTRFWSIHCPLEIWQHNEDNTAAVVTLVTTWLSPEIGSSPGIGRGCLVSAGWGGCSGRKQFHFLHPATGSRTQITCCRSPHTWALVVWDEVINTQWYTCIGAEGSFHFPSYSRIDLSPFYVSLKLYIVSLVIKKQRDLHRPSLDWWTQVMTSRVEWS